MIDPKVFANKLKDVSIKDVLSGGQFLGALPAAKAYRRRHRDLWLICEDAMEARDNGYWLFKYIVENHPEQEVIYAIDSRSPDYEKVRALGRTVEYGSFEHWVYYLAASRNISSQKGGKPNAAMCYLLEVGGLLNVSAVYFQPVPMAPDNESTEGFDMHLECDVSALPNELGYGVGDWVPYLTVDYSVVGSDGAEAASGTFMVMSASDGPHYGANIALPNADTYSLTFTFHSPAENGYLIHSDAETGPGKVLDDYFGDGPLTVTFDGWEYAPTEW